MSLLSSKPPWGFSDSPKCGYLSSIIGDSHIRKEREEKVNMNKNHSNYEKMDALMKTVEKKFL